MTFFWLKGRHIVRSGTKFRPKTNPALFANDPIAMALI